jgi:SnoaL-like domain
MSEQRDLIPVKLWHALEARDWEGAAALLHEACVADWPTTNERFVGRDAFIAVNRAYPGDWHLSIERFVAEGDTVVTQVRAVTGDVVDVAISFFEVENDLIMRITDWWVMLYDAPAWRTGWSTPIEI